MSRAILVIDADAAFQRLLSDQLVPYGFDIVIAADGADAMTRLPKVQPALLVIAVEEPDKQGFALFNKAKKGVAASIPIVLATATVAADSFINHRRLKLHADEYIDKRSLSADELLGKIDNLIGLGNRAPRPGEPPSSASIDLPIEIDEVPMELSDGDLVLEETFGEDEPVIQTRTPAGASIGAGIHVVPDGDAHNKATAIGASLDESLLTETDAAFDALLGDDLGGGPAPATGMPNDGAEPANLPVLVEPDSSRGPEPIEELVASGRHHAAVPHSIGAVDDADLGDLGLVDTDVADAGAAGPSFVDASTIVAGGAPPIPGNDEEIARPGGVLDLGLEELATRADEEQTSGMHDRRQLKKAHELERENARLKAELERAREGSGRVSGGANKDFLNLREMISARDKEILELRTSGTEKERALTDARERLRQMTHTKSVLETKNNQLEQRIVADGERADGAVGGLKAAEQRATDAQARLVDVEHTARAEIERMAAAIARADQARTDAEAAVIAERGAKVMAIEQERTRALAAQEAQFEAAHRDALAQRDQELEDQITALRRSHASELAAEAARLSQDAGAALEQRGHEIAELQEAQGRELSAQRDAHRRELTAGQHAYHELAADRDRAIAAVQAENDTVIAQLQEALIATQDGATAAQYQLEARLASAEQDHAEALAAAGDRHQRELAALKQAHGRQLLAARDEGAAALAEAEIARTDGIAAARAAGRAEAEADADADKAAASAERERAQREQLDAQKARHDRAMADLAGRHDAALAAATEQGRTGLVQAAGAHAGAMTRLRAEQAGALAEADIKLRTQRDADRADADRAVSAARADFEADLAEARDEAALLKTGLASARDQVRSLEQELATASGAMRSRDGELRDHARAVTERDSRIGELRADIEALENENAQYQEQVLKAYQKIKADEATVTRAKKALAIALTALDDEDKKKDGAGG